MSTVDGMAHSAGVGMGVVHGTPSTRYAIVPVALSFAESSTWTHFGGRGTSRSSCRSTTAPAASALVDSTRSEHVAVPRAMTRLHVLPTLIAAIPRAGRTGLELVSGEPSQTSKARLT